MEPVRHRYSWCRGRAISQPPCTRFGASSKAIARKLGISPRTIEGHRARILQKAGVKTTAQLSIMAFKGAQALKDRTAGFGRRTVHW
ncbi:LuxR C-terminal-related transcriptional regulator [Bradyrhizobium symbiodeficiens]|uniref:LuxR C-terminal-related transcriptional regulator n=1 Tax=Bradyrhizobium symbiodeficiens TaxID=1404367 RepID=UPI003BB10EA5